MSKSLALSETLHLSSELRARCVGWVGWGGSAIVLLSSDELQHWSGTLHLYPLTTSVISMWIEELLTWRGSLSPARCIFRFSFFTIMLFSLCPFFFSPSVFTSLFCRTHAHTHAIQFLFIHKSSLSWWPHKAIRLIHIPTRNSGTDSSLSWWIVQFARTPKRNDRLNESILRAPECSALMKYWHYTHTKLWDEQTQVSGWGLSSLYPPRPTFCRVRASKHRFAPSAGSKGSAVVRGVWLDQVFSFLLRCAGFVYLSLHPRHIPFSHLCLSVCLSVLFVCQSIYLSCMYVGLSVCWYR